MTLVWTRHANQQLDDLLAWLNGNATPEISLTIAERILGTVQLLQGMARLGRPGRIPSSRELVIRGTPYVLAYRIQLDAIYVIGIQHGAQRWPKDFPEDLEPLA